MSSSYITVKVVTNKGQRLIAELDSGDSNIDGKVHDGTFRVTAADFENFETMADLFSIVYKWFFDSLNDPVCSFDEMDNAFMRYGSGNISEIMSLNKKDVRYVAVFSREEFYDEPWGASWVSYDFLNKAFAEEHRDEEVYSDQEDCYGDNLYERFLADDELKMRTDVANKESEAQLESSVKTDVSGVGDKVTIGGISWTVIAVEGSNALVLADKSVGRKAYNKQCKEVTWETCTLRKWLNDEFYNKLSNAEMNIVVEVENENPDNAETGVSGGNKTEDKVFILSLDEVNNYLPEKSERSIGDYWWIRTPAEEQRQAIVIEDDGSILSEDGWVEFKYGVRPAIWIKQ